MADPRVRQIKIKTGVVKRLVKEKVMYEKEAKQQEEKIEKMRAEDGENYAIKKQAEILQESRMMIPDCQRRLEAAYTDLLQLLVSKDFFVLYFNLFFHLIQGRPNFKIFNTEKNRLMTFFIHLPCVPVYFKIINGV
ncbi:tubulin-specific chaperone A isoform 1-T1 [Trichechus inunguis]|uniref:Tubulin-specific chaperone A n=1 Tax=Trichechus manatus latirostris TaxID=127582 RepID=A0A2Y9QP60_TRIMA|nr:tubulin-specific chaperone A isoform X1 [Trichechus manatus latirostris]